MDNNMVPSYNLFDILGAAAQANMSKSPEDYLQFAIGSAINAAADTIKEINCKRIEADKEVLKSLAESGDDPVIDRGEAAGTYRKYATQAEVERMTGVGDAALMIGGGVLAAGLSAGIIYTLIDELT